MTDQKTIDAIELELVATCLIRPERIVDAGDLPPSAILGPRLRAAWATMLELWRAGELVTVLSVADATRGLSPTDLTEWVVQFHGGANVEWLAERVREAHLTREVLATLSDIRFRQERDDIRGVELVNEAFAALSKIRITAPDRPKPMGELMRERLGKLVELVDAQERGEQIAPSIATGIEGLDRVTGIRSQRICVLAARPSMGKSAMARQIADNASKNGYAVHHFSLEEGSEATADRGLSAASGIPATDIETLQNIGRSEIGQLMTAADRFGRRENWIVDQRGGLDADEIVRSVRAWRPRLETQLVIVDYVQLLKRRRRESAMDMLERSMWAFLECARNDRLAFLVLSQLNRECTKRDDKRPRLSDLKASGSLEEEAKTVLFLHREHVYDSDANPEHAEIIVAKNSNGRTGIARATWNGPTMTIR